MLYLSLKNLAHRPLHTLLSLLLFALGIGLVTLLLNLDRQVEAQFDRSLAGIDLVVGAKGSPLQLILCSMYHVDNPTGNIPLATAKAFLNPRHPLIARAVPLSLGDSYHGYRIAGTTYDILQMYHARLQQGRLWSHPMEAVLGANVAASLQLRLDDTFKSSHGLAEGMEEHEHDYRVVGILASVGAVIDQLILTPAESIWQSHEHQTADSLAGHPGGAEEMVNEQEPPSMEEEVTERPLAEYDSLAINKLAAAQRLRLMQDTSRDITSILIKFRNRTSLPSLNLGRNINQNTGLMAASPPNEIARLQTSMGLGASLLSVLAWIIVGVSGLSIFISLYASLRERRYELALMRAMGATPGALFCLILLEGLLLSLGGCILGLLSGHAGLGVLSGFMKNNYRYSLHAWQMLPEEAWLPAGALAVGVLASLLPAWQARRTDISETLTKV